MVRNWRDPTCHRKVTGDHISRKMKLEAGRRESEGEIVPEMAVQQNAA